ncbi:MAG: hypothetical protein ACJAZ0_001805 [Halioglobus sp.]|jgi:hypothetical protein
MPAKAFNHLSSGARPYLKGASTLAEQSNKAKSVLGALAVSLFVGLPILLVIYFVGKFLLELLFG